jgi:hypothetical protein
VFLLKPEIVVTCHFESELGECFEVTGKWHAAPGELATRPGFRVKQTFACLDGCDLAWTRSKS